ncbi:MAG TPA: LysM peptidoglycan-binding domain-containing protein [Anaerolineales bacterium]|nr:LysM peptidoglycan-binding domain-containing protein [Anaerolineales bacterium]
MNRKSILLHVILAFLLAACTAGTPPAADSGPQPLEATATPTPGGPTPTPLPVRDTYLPGEMVDYTAQSGDTLAALAARFNTSVEEIREANSVIPDNATTMPPGFPMQIPIYYRSFWGTPFQIIPDSQFVNGPAATEFDTAEFTSQYPGWINTYTDYVADENRTGPEIIDLVATNYSISPKLLLAIAEYLSGAVTSPTLSSLSNEYPLRFRSGRYQGFYRQLLWTANELNKGYYEWRTGELLELELPDGTLERPDPWQNAATVSLQSWFSTIMPIDQYRYAINPEGLAATYTRLFGDPWPENIPHIPGSLAQPEMLLPFPAGQVWAHTGGPHTAWGNGEPFAAIDFAPASDFSGCYTSNEWITAMADGIVARSSSGYLILDLDMDGDERTGWVVFYLHISGRDILEEGTVVTAGTPLGHPSCEGGSSTGTHVHIARKYNGEWMIADSVVPFEMEGWVVNAGDDVYEGTLVRYEQVVNACECSTLDTNVQATGNYDGVPIIPLPTITPTP